MAKKQQDQQQQDPQNQSDQENKLISKPDLPVKNYVKRAYKSVMYNDCVIRLRAGQELDDPFLFNTLKDQGIEFVNDLKDCVFE